MVILVEFCQSRSSSVLDIALLENGSHNYTIGLIFDPVIEVFHIVTLLICGNPPTTCNNRIEAMVV